VKTANELLEKMARAEFDHDHELYGGMDDLWPTLKRDYIGGIRAAVRAFVEEAGLTDQNVKAQRVALSFTHAEMPERLRMTEEAVGAWLAIAEGGDDE
jgi:hypothetical protein